LIYFVRHGQSIWNAENRIQGHADKINPLSELGIKQAEDITLELSKLPIKYIYSSDLQRARQTAEIINKKFNLEIIFDERLREFNTGPDFQGKMQSERPKEFLKDPHKYSGENSRDVFIRVKNFLDDIITNKISNALVVAHGGSISMVRYILDNPNITIEKVPSDLSVAWYNEPKNCEIVRLNIFP